MFGNRRGASSYGVLKSIQYIEKLESNDKYATCQNRVSVASVDQHSVRSQGGKRKEMSRALIHVRPLETRKNAEEFGPLRR